MSVEEMFESSDEFLEFERIPESERRHNRPDLCAFIYLDEKFPGKFDMVSAARHDEIFLDIEVNQIETLTQEDVTYLSRCGVRYSEDSLAMFV